MDTGRTGQVWIQKKQTRQIFTICCDVDPERGNITCALGSRGLLCSQFKEVSTGSCGLCGSWAALESPLLSFSHLLLSFSLGCGNSFWLLAILRLHRASRMLAGLPSNCGRPQPVVQKILENESQADRRLLDQVSSVLLTLHSTSLAQFVPSFPGQDPVPLGSR